eukprot:10170038-Heterocapsa_arctica.AAC.1
MRVALADSHCCVRMPMRKHTKPPSPGAVQLSQLSQTSSTNRCPPNAGVVRCLITAWRRHAHVLRAQTTGPDGRP